MPALERLGQSLVVSCQSSKASEPTKGSLENSASRQQYKPSFCFLMFDHRELDSCLISFMSRVFAGVALIDSLYLNSAPGG